MTRVRERKEHDFTEYLAECHARVGETDYFSTRGISLKTIESFKLGYDPDWKPPLIANAPATPRAIIPTGKGSYVAMATEPDTPIPKQKIGTPCLFNAEALNDTNCPHIFVAYDESDALSLIEAGGQCVGLGNVSNTHIFIEAVKSSPPKFPLVLLQDNDSDIIKAQNVLKEMLEELNIPFIEANINGIYKDLNEALIKDRDGFIDRVQDPMNKPEAIKEYAKQHSVSVSLDAFMRSIEKPRIKPIPTGFTTLDAVLDGGLHEGLYTLGAISSIGKTTITLQIADQVAQHRNDVINISLEMSKPALMSKTLSRLTFLEDNRKDKKSGYYHACTARQITNGEINNDIEKNLMDNALRKYRQFSDRQYIFESIGGMSVERVCEIVNEHVQATGNRPLVIVDYLQILLPQSPKGSDKQNIDNAVLELKRLSMKHKIPVLVVSSFNRLSYDSPVSMASFKESGAIEYSSDVLLGLQYKGMDEADPKNSRKITEEQRKSERRELELKILKNRNGASGESIFFDYYPQFNLFDEKRINDPATRKMRG